MHTNFFEKEENLKLDENSYLELINLSHAEELFSVVDNNRDYLKEWLPWLDHNKKLEDSKNFIQDSIESFNGNKSVQLVIFNNKKLVGCIGLHNIDWEKEETKIGYWISKDAQGKGLVSKATKILEKYVFEELKLKKLEIRCAIENNKSRAIPERLGFKFSKILESNEWLYDHFVDHAVYEKMNL
ncbi:MAG: GNAT family N-acetyltransferase [Candidatus Sericytochromatia bacterium]